MEFRYSVKDALSVRQADALASKLVYSVEHIRGVAFDEDAQEIVLKYEKAEDLPAIEQTLEKMVRFEKEIRPIKRRVVKVKEAAGQQDASDLDAIHELFSEDGKVNRGLAVELFDKVDLLFQRIAAKHQADIRKYPSLISAEALHKCNYVNNFPQNAYLVSEFPHQLDVLEQVRESEHPEQFTRPTGYVLSPAVCFHCYEELSAYRSDEPVLLTSRTTCFRHEAPWRSGRHRLHEFDMREIVFVGPADYVEDMRNGIMEEVWAIFDEIGFCGHIETASDPFYFPQDAIKGQHQLMANMKYELIVGLNEGREGFSIASFNNVKNTLCSEFEITDSNGEYLHSGCVAFGIDRWVYALLRSFGTDWNEWPQQVRAIFDPEHTLLNA